MNTSPNGVFQQKDPMSEDPLPFDHSTHTPASSATTYMKYLPALKTHPRLTVFSHTVERAILSAVRAGHTHNVGLLNLGQTCYINAMLQFLYHTAPMRDQLEDYPAGSSLLSEGLCTLFRARSDPSSSWSDVLTPLIELVVAIFEQAPTFLLGQLANVAEYFLCILQDTKNAECPIRSFGCTHFFLHVLYDNTSLHRSHLGRNTLCGSSIETNILKHCGLHGPRIPSGN